MKINRYIKLIFTISLFCIINCMTVFADRGDDAGLDDIVSEDRGKAIWVSNFDGGYKEIKYNIGSGERKYKVYLAAIGPATAHLGTRPQSTSNVAVFLYDLRNTKQDEELVTAMETDGLGISSVFMQNGKEIKNPTIYTSSFFMWPLASSGEIVPMAQINHILNTVTDETDRNKQITAIMEPIVKNHNIHDYAEISKPENFNIAYTLQKNSDASLKSYIDGYNYRLNHFSAASMIPILSEVDAKLGTNFAAHTSKIAKGSGINRHIVSIGQTFLTHASYLREAEATGTAPGAETTSKTEEITQTAKNAYDPAKDPENNGKSTDRFGHDKAYYENQCTYFLSYANIQFTSNGAFNHTTEALLNESGMSTFPRNVGNTRGDRYFSSITPKAILNGTNVISQASYFNFNLDSHGIYNKMLMPAVGGNFESINGYQNVPPEFIPTVNSLCATYKGAWEKLYQLAITTYPNLPTICTRDGIDYTQMATADQAVEYARTNPTAFYNFEKILAITMCKYFLVSGMANESMGAGLYYINPNATYGGYDLPAIENESMVSAGNVTVGDVQLVNENVENDYASMMVVDLCKALGVDGKSFSEIAMGKTPTGVSKRAVKLIDAALKGENIGVYLTNSEINSGIVGMDGDSLQNLQAGYPYVIVASMMFERPGLDPEIIPKIFTDSKYNISTYKGVKLEEEKKEEDKKEEESKPNGPDSDIDDPETDW